MYCLLKKCIENQEEWDSEGLKVNVSIFYKEQL